MEILNNTAKLVGTYAGNEVTNKSTASVQSTGNFMVKTGDRIYGDVGTLINYTISLMTGSLVPDDLSLTDVPHEGLEFVEGSLTLNGVSKSGTVNDLVIDYQPDTSYTIKYQATKTQAGDLMNTAFLTGTYCSDLVTIESPWVLKDTGTLIEKTADRAYAEVGTVTNFTVNISVGKICPDDLVFSDIMDDGLVFVEGSLKLDGESLATHIDDLVIDFAPETSYVVEYKAIKTEVGN